MADLSYFHGVSVSEDGEPPVVYSPPYGGSSEPPDPEPSLDFSQRNNSQYIGQVV